MKQFLLGAVTTVLVVAIGAALLVASVGSGVDPAGTPPSPAPSGVRVEAPDDLSADETWLGRVTLSSEDVVSADGGLVDVTADGEGVRFGPDGLRARRLAVEATLPFDTVAAQVGDGVRLYAVSGGRAGVERTATILGRDVTVRATGTVRADRGQLLIEPETVELGGPGFLDSAVSAAARALVTIRQDVPGVPAGLTLRDVDVDAAGFGVRLDGADVAIGP